MRRTLLRSAAVLAIAVLAACTQKNTADDQAQQQVALVGDVALGIDRLLLFPNPIGTDPFAQDGGTFETDTTAYTQAYYAAIDPTNAKDTIDKWKAANGFSDSANPQPGTEHLAVFRDVKDLGYGRRMTGRRNTSTDPNVDGSVAFYVENYNVTPNGSASYASDLNVDAAIRRDTQWHVGTNAIEWSVTPCIPGYDPPDCSGTVKFAKYFNFSSKDGTRQLAVDLDGHGLKAMPGPCITCHGGRGDPLTPPDSSGNPPRFPLVENSLSRKRGDVQARLQGMNVDSFSYSTTQAGFAKSDQQSTLLDFNQWIMCTYPWDATGTTLQTITGQSGWGSCTRTAAGPNEWQGIAAEMIQKWYGGPTMSAAFSDAYVPPTWNSTTTITGTNFGPIDLYNNVVAPYCRTCHILRGTKNQNDIDFMTYGVPAAGVNPATGFLSFADRIKVMVFDRGNMPLAQIPHEDFWNSSAPQTLASFVDAMTAPGTATSNGAPLMPGRAIPDPGPDRMVRTGANAVLTGENSLFATTFSWSLDPTGPQTATITNANNMVAIFNPSVSTANVSGNVPYKVRLTVDGGVSKTINITVDDNFPDPLNIKFAHVKNVLQNVVHATGQQCVACHKSGSVPLPPIWYSSKLAEGGDRDGDTLVNATDDAWFLKALSGRVNLTEITASPLLRKPSGNHHAGGKLLDLTTSAGLQNYSIIYNWVLAGMQPGGVAASALVNGGNLGSPTPVPLTYNGLPPYATGIALDGSPSIAATSYLWSVSGPAGPTGAVPFVSNPTSASAAASPSSPPTLNLPNAGTYVVQLQVGNGTDSDVSQRTIVVAENPVTADFVPGAVGVTTSVPISFSGNPLSGPINLSSASSGSPATCQWQVTGPAGPALDGVAIPVTLIKSCGTSAVLNVPSGNLGNTYAVTLTAISSLGLSSAPVVHNLQIQSAGSGVVANAGADSTTTVAFTNPSSAVPTGGVSAPSIGGIPLGTVGLNGSASTGPGTLTYSWTIISSPVANGVNGSYQPSISNASSAIATLNVHRAGLYTVQLFVSNGLPPGPSNTATRNITVVVPPADIFGSTGNPNTSVGVAGIFQTNGRGCTGCHDGSFATPSWIDSGSPTLYTRVTSGFVNTTDPARSLILACPSEGSQVCASLAGMPQQSGFTDADSSSYNVILNWIIGGAPNN